jgi:hypothetical protein
MNKIELLKERWAKVPKHERSDMLARVARAKWSKVDEKTKLAHMAKMRKARREK